MIIIKNFSISLFILLVIFADLKVTISPYIHWIAWLVLIFPLFMFSIYKKGIVKSPLLWLGLFIFFLGVVSSLFTGLNIETVIQCVKLLLIFSTLYFFLYYSNFKWESVVKIINLSVLINVIFLIIGTIGGTVLATLMTADGRWGTILAYPGSLVKIGVLGFYINVMSVLLLHKKDKIFPMLMLILSMYIIFMDGSRTGMLTVLLTLPIIIFFYAILNYKNKIKFVMLPTIFIIALSASVIFAIPILKESRIGNNIMNILQSSSVDEALKKIDPARYSMYLEAMNKILENPFIGSGAFTTVGNIEDSAGMVVHNTYLQVWGDFGLFGLAGIFLVYFGWFALVPRILNKLQKNINLKENVVVCCSILILTYFILNGLFHPYSTEMSEWILYIIPLTICYSFFAKEIQLK
ncbi:O-antigen ligase family protein [Solibacillus sp. A46]|uniref:O-antigen ligase family protein n=2 Tax=Solibacillus faecavium TaxID=2762221 RepID=A0ABR8Y0P0_9BACL|nr:O-antigen ligase family protein [Solibacillus faecavium]